MTNRRASTWMHVHSYMYTLDAKVRPVGTACARHRYTKSARQADPHRSQITRCGSRCRPRRPSPARTGCWTDWSRISRLAARAFSCPPCRANAGAPARRWARRARWRARAHGRGAACRRPRAPCQRRGRGRSCRAPCCRRQRRRARRRRRRRRCTPRARAASRARSRTAVPARGCASRGTRSPPRRAACPERGRRRRRSGARRHWRGWW
mmetsp:Transcript_14208/g.47788  ORF Transcript_14208/g.47788 Transcript_14208/m.47788 type:complete len:209 (+) Transcript_14208:86-712(+)